MKPGQLKREFGGLLLLEFLAILFTTLQGYYFYGIHLAPFPLIGFGIIIVLFLHSGAQLRTTDALCLGTLFVIFGASAVVGLFTIGDEFYWRSTAGTFVGPLYGLVFISYFRNRPGPLITCLSATLFIHVAAGTFQFVSFYLLGHYPDLLEPITGEAQRYMGTGGLTGLVRPTGLFPEPAHYSTCVIALIFIISRFKRDLTLFQIFALLTSIFNFSLLGVVLVGTFLICYWLSRSQKYLMKFVTAGVAAAIVIYSTGIVQNTVNRFENLDNDASYNGRYTGSLEYFNSLPLTSKVLGTGVGLNEANTYGSVYSYFFIHNGVAFTFALTICGFWYLRVVCRVSLMVLVYLALFFAGSLMPTYIMFWMMLLSIGLLEQMDYRSKVAGLKTREQGAREMRSIGTMLPLKS